MDKYYALGVAYAWLCWVDEQTEDGHTHLLPDEVDAEMLLTGFADALRAIGWVELDEATGEVVAVDWEKHCGPTAKKRAEDALRQAKKRARDRADNVTEVSQKNCDKRVTRKEKNNIDTKGEHSTTVDTSSPDVPCPPAPDDFAGWLRAVGAVIPMLRRLNLDRPL
ncbi:MAG: hypothetical protein IKY92_00055, partial [Akkermansia sp.]|nr:hypothetical protein [Akkermansia sp.]